MPVSTTRCDNSILKVTQHKCLPCVLKLEVGDSPSTNAELDLCQQTAKTPSRWGKNTTKAISSLLVDAQRNRRFGRRIALKPNLVWNRPTVAFTASLAYASYYRCVPTRPGFMGVFQPMNVAIKLLSVRSRQSGCRKEELPTCQFIPYLFLHSYLRIA